MHAAWPWSGHYVPTPQLYVSAHTTQFVSVGWKYAPVGSGSGLLAKGGSYVTLVSPAETATTADPLVSPDLSVIVEKMSHEGSTSAWAGLPAYDTANERLILRLGAQYAGRELALWKSTVPSSVVASGKDSGVIPSVDGMLIRRSASLHADSTGAVTIDVCVDCMFTLTTLLHAGNKGGYGHAFGGPPIPAPAEFPLPFNSSFDDIPAGLEADLFIDQAGSWEAVPTAGGGMAMRQMVEQKPICWAGDQAPITIVGSTNWSDVSVSVSLRLEAQDGMPWVGARIQGRNGDPSPLGPLEVVHRETSADTSQVVVCDATAFPIATKIQFKGLQQAKGSNLTTETACRHACCADHTPACTLYQFWAVEPAGRQCWLGRNPSDGTGTTPGSFVSRSTVPLTPSPPRPPPPPSTFTNANGVMLAVDVASARWLLAPCAACLHRNGSLLGEGPLSQLLPGDSLVHLTGPSTTWAKLRLELVGATASGWLDDHLLFQDVDVSGAPSKGFAGFGMGSFTPGLFDDFAATAAGQTAKPRLKIDEVTESETIKKTVRLWDDSPFGFWGGPVNESKLEAKLAEYAQLSDVVDTLSLVSFFVGDTTNKTLLRETGGLVPAPNIGVIIAALQASIATTLLR